MKIIHWAGDSTNTCNKAHRYPQTGIAQAFDRYTAPDVVIYDHSINGRSTKSFIDQGRLDTIDREMASVSGAQQFLFIQFGHNDEKKVDPDRYTDPDTTFIDNLGKYADVARKNGAVPLFITPLERANFSEDGVHLVPSDHVPYVNAYHRAAERYGVAIVDHYALSRKYVEQVGQEAVRKMYMHIPAGEVFWLPEGLDTDNTHLQYFGAMKFGELLAREMIHIGVPFDGLIDASVLRELDAGGAGIDTNALDEGVADEY